MSSALERIESRPESSRALVEVKDLTIAFPRGGARVQALRGVTLSIAPGEIVGLVGESGSGKSVFGLALLGLLAPKDHPEMSGSAVVSGVDMVSASPERRRLNRRAHLGAVFQDPMTSLNPTMRVGLQVAEKAGSLEEAERLFRAVGIPDPSRRLRAFPHELSGGLRQRVMIAMAVAGDPQFIVADEPTTALDVTVQAQILELIAKLRDELGTSFLFVTHDLGVAAEISDRIAVLYGGRLAEVGPATTMFHNPRHPYSIGLLRSRLLLDTDRLRPLSTLPGEPPDPRTLPEGCAFAPRCSERLEPCSGTQPELVRLETPVHVAACFALDQASRTTERPLRDPWPAANAPRGPVALVISQLEKAFSVRRGLHRDSLYALRGVDLEVHKGEAVALVGESGCGKSTLLRIVAGLEKPDSGSVDLARGSRPQMIFQDAGASLTPWLSSGELIEERLIYDHLPTRERRARVDAALALVGLPAEVAQAKASQLSGGQRQRVALARAIIAPPELLLCDEPTSALDVSLAATVLNLIGRLRREFEMGVIFVTHDLAAARVVADRIAVMYLGRIVEIGTAEELSASPIHPYTKALMSAVPGAKGRVRLMGEPANALAPPPGCGFHPRCLMKEPRCAVEDPALVPLGVEPWARAVACPVALAKDGVTSPT